MERVRGEDRRRRVGEEELAGGRVGRGEGSRGEKKKKGEKGVEGGGGGGGRGAGRQR